MLREKITSELKIALKTQNKSRLAAIRLILAALKSKDIDARGKDPITDAGIMSMLQSMIKQRRESIYMYTKGNRKELADKEQTEIDIIQSFLPQPLNAKESAQSIEKAISISGASSIKDMGKVISYLKENFSGRLDFSTIAQEIKEKLGN